MILYQHIKRGTVYRILHNAVFQSIGAYDCERVVVYENIHDHQVWVRPADEFFDPKRFRECPENTELDSGILDDERDGTENIA